MEKQLPNNWVASELSEIVSFVLGGDWGKDPETFQDDNYKKVLCIRGGEIKKWREEKGRTASLRLIKDSSLEKRKLIEGDILLEISGGGPDQPVGRTVYIDQDVLNFNPEIPKVGTNFLRLLRIYNILNSKFVNYYLQFFYNTGEVVNYQGGSNNLRNLKFKEYQTINIPLAPLKEQQRIVKKLDALYSELDDVKSRLETIPELLKNFRQAVLNLAVTGKLTEAWRKEKKLGEWSKITLGQVGSWKGGGTPSKSKKEYWENGNVLWVTPKDMKSLIIEDSIDKITETSVENSSANYIKENSILFVTRSGILRRIFPISLTSKIVTVNQDIKALTPDINFHPKFLLFVLRGLEEDMRSKCIKSGTTVESIEFSSLKGYSINYPRKEEQKKVIEIVNNFFSKADQIQIHYESLVKRIENLPQAILQKAFKGDLVEQLPTDGDAKDLLEEIKALRDELKPTKKGKRKTVKS